MIEAGVDEAGRGPLAGPVFAAAVILGNKHSISNLNSININSYVYKNNNFELIDNIYFSEIDYELFFNNLHKKTLNYWKNNNIVD